MNPDDDLLARIREVNRDIRIRSARAQDGRAYTELMNRSYRRQKPGTYFAWQFLSAPHPAQLFLAWDKKTLAACYGVQVLLLNNGKRCGFVVDLLIDEAYRNRGLHLLLEEQVAQFAAEHGAMALAALPNPMGMKAHINMPGWRNLGAVPTLELAGTPASSPRPPSATVTAAPRVGFARPPEFLEWRFARHPQHRYEYIKIPGGAHSVVKTFQSPDTGTRIGDIVDFQAEGVGEGGLRELFGRSCIQLAAQSASPITSWALPHTAANRVLKDMGFKERDGQRFFCVRVLRDEYQYLYDFPRWHLVQADSEVY